MKNFSEINKKEASKVSGGGFGGELGKGWSKINKAADTAAKDVGGEAKRAERNTREFLHKVRDARDEQRDTACKVGIPEIGTFDSKQPIPDVNV